VSVCVLSVFSVRFVHSVSGVVPPPAPSAVEAEAVNETAIRLSWTAPSYDVGPVTGYTVIYTRFISAASNLSALSLDDPATSSVSRYQHTRTGSILARIMNE